MKYDEIMKLLDAGFNADQIMKLVERGEPAQAEPAPAPADPEPNDNSEVFYRGLAEFVKKLEKAEPAPASPDPAPTDPEPTPAPTDPEPAPAEPGKNKLDEMSEKFSNSVAKFEENLNSLTKAFQDNNILLSKIDDGEQLTPDQQLARLLDGKREEKPKKF